MRIGEGVERRTIQTRVFRQNEDVKKQYEAYTLSMLPSYEVQNPNCEGSEENAKDFMEFGQFWDSTQSGLGAIVDKLSGVVNGMKSFDCIKWRQLRRDAGIELKENLKKY